MALRGLKVVEMAGLAPVPFCGMILADFGALVTRVDKASPFTMDTMGRGKRSIAVNLKSEHGVEVVRDLCKSADILIEPYRPGIMEKAGLGPDVLCSLNPRLIYARLTGFGQAGLYRDRAGHDINYLAVSGLLSMLGRAGEKPTPPLNLMGDFAAGGMMCTMGILMALFERSKSGMGQVIDSSMVDGVGYLSTFLSKSRSIGIWQGPRGTNMLDTGAPFYDTYETKDGKFMAVGAIEPQFYQLLLQGLGLAEEKLPDQNDQQSWPDMKERFAAVFKSKTRDEWCAIFDVLEMQELPTHAHTKARDMMLHNSRESQWEPAPAPRLSRSPAAPSLTQPLVGQHTHEVLLEMGYTPERIKKLVDGKVIMQHTPKASL